MAGYKYAAMKEQDSMLNERLYKVFAETVLTIDYTGNIIVIKTFPGVANVAAEALDALDLKEVVGTVAGDNTIFVLIRYEENVLPVMERFKKMMK